MRSDCDAGILIDDEFEYSSGDLEEHGWEIDERMDNCGTQSGQLINPASEDFCRISQPVCVDAQRLTVDFWGSFRCEYKCDAMVMLQDESLPDLYRDRNGPNVLAFGPVWYWEYFREYKFEEVVYLTAMSRETTFIADFGDMSEAPSSFHHQAEYNDGLLTFRVDDEVVLDSLRIAEAGTRLVVPTFGISLHTQNPTQASRVDSVRLEVFE